MYANMIANTHAHTQTQTDTHIHTNTHTHKHTQTYTYTHTDTHQQHSEPGSLSEFTVESPDLVKSTACQHFDQSGAERFLNRET